MAMRKIRIPAMLLALALVLTLPCAMAAKAAGPAEVGKPAPDFELTTLDGEVFRLSDQLGKVVFLNIWATWCPPCVAEMPEIQKLADDYPDELVVIGVSCDEGRSEVDAFLEEYGYTYPIAMDEGYRIAGILYPSYYIPNSIFIAPDGTVVLDANAGPTSTATRMTLTIGSGVNAFDATALKMAFLGSIADSDAAVAYEDLVSWMTGDGDSLSLDGYYLSYERKNGDDVLTMASGAAPVEATSTPAVDTPAPVVDIPSVESSILPDSFIPQTVAM